MKSFNDIGIGCGYIRDQEFGYIVNVELLIGLDKIESSGIEVTFTNESTLYFTPLSLLDTIVLNLMIN